MKTLMLTISVLVALDDGPQKSPSARPAVYVLRVKGKVVVEGRTGKRRVGPGDKLLAGEILSAPADAEALLVFLLSGEQQRLKPSSRTTLKRDGGEPAGALEPAGRTKLSAKNLTKVREVEVREGGGVGVIRGANPTTEPRITPLFGTFVMTTRPTFTWPPVAKAEGYVVELKDGAGRRWKADAKQAKLDYPAKEKALALGQKYLWTVKARLPGGNEQTVVDESNFKVLFPGEPEALAAVQKLAESDDPEDLLLAAAAYEGYGVLDEALRVFEKLARLQPGVARFQRALARYYQHAGRADKAKEALERATKLEAPADSHR